MRILRASAMPRAWLCPGSMTAPNVIVETDDGASRLGTATHDALGYIVRGELGVDEAASMFAVEYRVDEKDLRILLIQGANAWREIKASFPSPKFEDYYESKKQEYTIRGHVDMISVAGASARILDWKTGRKDSDYSQQMRAYACLVLDCYELIEEVTCTLVWIRECEIETITVKRADAEKWLRDVERQVVNWDGRYHAGSHCLYCPRAHECEAATVLQRSATRAIVESDTTALAQMSNEQIVGLYEKAALVAKMSKAALDAIKAHVGEHGPVITASGSTLALLNESRRKLDTATAWPILQAQFTDDELASCIDISLSKASAIVSAKTEKGKGKAVAKFHEALADAIHTTTFDRLVTRRG